MPVTFTATYKDVLAADTLEKISELCEDDSYALDDVLEFIDQNSEEDFLAYYEDYVDLGEVHGYEPVDAFLKENGLDDLESFEDAYLGEYNSPADFAEEYLQNEIDRLSYFIVVDWEKTSEYMLDHDFDRVGDFYFRTCF
jgi:antirestriction protein